MIVFVFVFPNFVFVTPPFVLFSSSITLSPFSFHSLSISFSTHPPHYLPIPTPPLFLSSPHPSSLLHFLTPYVFSYPTVPFPLFTPPLPFLSLTVFFPLTSPHYLPLSTPLLSNHLLTPSQLFVFKHLLTEHSLKPPHYLPSPLPISSFLSFPSFGLPATYHFLTPSLIISSPLPRPCFFPNPKGPACVFRAQKDTGPGPSSSFPFSLPTTCHFLISPLSHHPLPLLHPCFFSGLFFQCNLSKFQLRLKQKTCCAEWNTELHCCFFFIFRPQRKSLDLARAP